MLPSNGKPTKLCACGASFEIKNIRQRWCKPWCYARQDELRRRAIDWHRHGRLTERAEQLAPPSPKTCASCGRTLDSEAIQSEDTHCSICRRIALYAGIKRIRLSQQDADRPEPLRSLGTVTIGSQQFDLVWNGRGALPRAQWSYHH